MEMRPTLEAVAALAGVSTATVSRVLNDSAKVSEATRAAVMEAVAQLHYLPNPAARNLARRRTDTIALVISEAERRLFADPFFPAVVHGIAEQVADTELQLVLLLARGEQQQRKVERYVLEGHVDGVIIVSLHADDVLPRALASAGVPVVLSGRPSGDDADISFVDVDNRGGARSACEHLLRTRKTVATITGPLDMAVSADRFDGYRDALAAAGLELRADLVAHGDFTVESGARAVDRLLAAEPGLDGIFAASDAMGVGALEQLAKLGRVVPDDVAVVGFDDLEIAATASIPLTTMRQPFDEMTRALTDLLLRRVAGDERAKHVVLPTTLVRRRSA
ncbi:MAG TPA: LacI family DNA-binding transcriptional regulator [Gaiellaceae bacterium]|jgi:DNA-binding LacI/PurR family transcriptional regulator|nr:LacI family DNA-binding transcriptional regulator [Gaiellaceae bacterium]